MDHHGRPAPPAVGTSVGAVGLVLAIPLTGFVAAVIVAAVIVAAVIVGAGRRPRDVPISPMAGSH